MRKYNRVIETDENNNVVSTHLKEVGKEEIVIKKLYTEEQKYRMNQCKDIAEFIQNNEGRYIHNIYKYNFPYFSELQALDQGNKNNIHIVRFIVLASYLTFGGKLFDKNNNEIKKSNLKNIWDVKNRNSIKQTYEKLKEVGYISETEEGYIMINQDLFVKGKIDNWKQIKKQDENYTYTRLFTDNIQDMYYSTPDKQRKQLANLFKILPFINFRYNIFCSNPNEIEKDKLDFLNWTDLARICGYEDNKNINKFKKDMLNLEIFNYATIGQFLSKGKYYICVNPKVYFSGHDIESVEFLYKAFEMFENK